MWQKVFTNYSKKELCTYVNIRSGKPLKATSKRTSNSDLRSVSFLESGEVPLPCGTQGKFRSKGEGKVEAIDKSPESQPTTQATHRWLQKFTRSSGVATTAESRPQKTPPRITIQHHIVHTKEGQLSLQRMKSPEGK